MFNIDSYKIMDWPDIKALQSEYLNMKINKWNLFAKNSKTNSWYGVALRSKDGSISTLEHGGSCIDTPLLKIMPTYQQLLQWFQCELKRVRFSRLIPGGKISKHSDVAAPEDWLDVRLQLPILTNDDVEFFINDRIIKMKEGELWFIDVSKEHGVFNNGSSERITLIIDCKINSWVKEIVRGLNHV